MKKILPTLLCASLWATCSQAQITLTQASYTGTIVGTTDTLLSSNAFSVFPPLPAATNATWDLTGAVSTAPPSYFSFIAPDLLFFPACQFAHQGSINIHSYTAPDSGQYDISATAYSEIGLKTGTSRNQLTGGSFGPTDSFIIPTFSDTFSSPEILVQFPATYHSTWTSRYYEDYPFLVDAAGVGWVNEPCFERFYITIIDSVVGWGKMKVLLADGSSSGYINVLQIRERIWEVDSEFAGGVPASNAILSVFGLTQGETIYGYYQYFRSADPHYIAYVNYGNDSTYSTPTGVTTFATGRQPNNGITKLNNGSTVHIYPNPASGGSIHIDISGAQSGAYTFELINMTGECMVSGIISQPGNEVALPAGITSGIYFIRLRNETGEEVLARPVDIVK